MTTPLCCYSCTVQYYSIDDVRLIKQSIPFFERSIYKQYALKGTVLRIGNSHQVLLIRNYVLVDYPFNTVWDKEARGEFR